MERRVTGPARDSCRSAQAPAATLAPTPRFGAAKRDLLQWCHVHWEQSHLPKRGRGITRRRRRYAQERDSTLGQNNGVDENRLSVSVDSSRQDNTQMMSEAVLCTDDSTLQDQKEAERPTYAGWKQGETTDRRACGWAGWRCALVGPMKARCRRASRSMLSWSQSAWSKTVASSAPVPVRGAPMLRVSGRVQLDKWHMQSREKGGASLHSWRQMTLNWCPVASLSVYQRDPFLGGRSSLSASQCARRRPKDLRIFVGSRTGAVTPTYAQTAGSARGARLSCPLARRSTGLWFGLALLNVISPALATTLAGFFSTARRR